MHIPVWAIVALSLPISLVAGVAAIGSFLPKEFDGRAEAVFPNPPGAVFAAISNFEKHPISSHMAKKIAPLAAGGGLPTWREDLGASSVTVKTVEAAAPARIVRELRDSVVPMSARWTIELAPADGGTRVTVVQTGVVERGTWHVPFFRFILRVLGGARKGPEAYLESLGDECGAQAAPG